ncbi:MAG TPA: aldo/keto reductase [Gaiellaceae bacterium]|nr:aldo/keto reductase [Gaiellaceae bacterium]
MIEKAPFGSTGHESTRTIFGAAALMHDSTTRADADAALALLLEHGVNHIDVAASYGEAEVWIAPWLSEHRDRFFLATKTGERERGRAHDEIRRSLERMGVDRIDLIQLHNLVDRGEWETAMGPGGALEAAVEARDEGLVRFIGVTGHGLDVAVRHLESLAEFPFDSVLFPYNYGQLADERYGASVEELIAACEERGVAIQTIKSLSRGRWLSEEHHAAPWYEPLTDPDDIHAAVAWTLARPGIFLNTVSDVALLRHVLAAAESPGAAPSDERMDELAMRPLFDAAFPD